ncbi:MAG: hypothetical protein ACF8QF_10455 [Phycisphaerales bacterium]
MGAVPLFKPDSVEALTPVERALFRVPVLRTLLRWPLRNQREIRLARAVREQMGDRDVFDAGAWGEDAVRRRVAIAVGQAFADTLGFKRPNLHPDDPAALLLIDRDFLVGVEIRLSIEDALGRAFPDDCYEDWATAGDLVDRIAAHMRR